MLLSDIAVVVNGKLQGEDQFISSLSINTRELVPGQLFVAIKGEQFDGHDFLQNACEKGAIGAVISSPQQLAIPTIYVNDTRVALGQIAAYHRRLHDIPIIAVTGSCGKTTTKSMIASILAQMGSTLSPEKSFNNEIGVPLTLLQLNKNHRFAVIEMGANHLNEIAQLSKMAQQTVSLITNVAPAHLEGFGSIKGVARAKGEIYEALSPTGIAIINRDDQFYDYWLQNVRGKNVLTFGIEHEADVQAKNITLDKEGRASFEVLYPDGELLINLPLLGRHNVMNALSAIAATYVVGARKEAISKGLSEVMPVNKRLVQYQGLGGALIIDDTYNANPLSVSAALQMLAHGNGEKIFVFGGMAELGEQSEQFHIEIGQQAKNLGIDKLYTCGKLAHLTADAFGSNGAFFDDQATLIEALKSMLRADVVVLVKGSRSSHMETIVQAIIQET